MYTIITRNDCTYCDKAKKLLKHKGLPFVTYNIEETSSRFLLSLLMKAELKTVPQVFTPSGKHIGGYNHLETLLTELEGAEY